jgi:hypothetical protein
MLVSNHLCMKTFLKQTNLLLYILYFYVIFSVHRNVSINRRQIIIMDMVWKMWLPFSWIDFSCCWAVQKFTVVVNIRDIESALSVFKTVIIYGQYVSRHLLLFELQRGCAWYCIIRITCVSSVTWLLFPFLNYTVKSSSMVQWGIINYPLIMNWHEEMSLFY